MIMYICVLSLNKKNGKPWLDFSLESSKTYESIQQSIRFLSIENLEFWQIYSKVLVLLWQQHQLATRNDLWLWFSWIYILSKFAILPFITVIWAINWVFLFDSCQFGCFFLAVVVIFYHRHHYFYLWQVWKSSRHSWAQTRAIILIKWITATYHLCRLVVLRCVVSV